MTPVVRVFLEPAMQDIGVHTVAAGQCRDGCARFLTCGYQLGFEFGGIRSVGVLSGTSGYL
jgi:hypothetical protein